MAQESALSFTFGSLMLGTPFAIVGSPFSWYKLLLLGIRVSFRGFFLFCVFAFALCGPVADSMVALSWKFVSCLECGVACIQ